MSGNLKALVVDDEVLIALSIKDLLRTLGYDVTIAVTIHELRSAVAAARFDLVVTDSGFATWEEMTVLGGG